MRNDWTTSPLGDLADVAISGVDKHILPGEQLVRVCNYLHVYRNRRLRAGCEFDAGSATPTEIARFQLRAGDVLITKDSETPDDIGIPALIVDEFEETICGYHLALIRPRPGLNAGFLSYVFQTDSAKRHFLKTATGLTRFGLHTRSIAGFPIHHPQPTEQAAIARILDAVDTAIERTRAAVHKAQELRSSLLAELLSRGIGPSGTVRKLGKSKQGFTATKLGLLPSDWRLSAVGSEFELQNGFTLNEDRRPKLRKRRYLRVANVQRDSLKLDDVQELEAKDREFAPRSLAKDDLLVVEGHADRMQIGRCARVTDEAVGMTFQNHLFRLRTKGDVLPDFGCLWLNSAYGQRYWNACCATSSGLNTINQRMLKRLVIPVLPKKEQETICACIQAQRTHLESLQSKLTSLEQLKKSLMHDLLTGTVRVDAAKQADLSQP